MNPATKSGILLHVTFAPAPDTTDVAGAATYAIQQNHFSFQRLSDTEFLVLTHQPSDEICELSDDLNRVTPEGSYTVRMMNDAERDRFQHHGILQK